MHFPGHNGPMAVIILLAGVVVIVGAGELSGASQLDWEASSELPSRYGIAPLDTLGSAPSLSDYLGYALAHNAELQAAVAAWRATEERVAQAGSLADPRFQVTEYLEAVETRVGPQERAFALSQTLPWFGKLSLKSRVERERARAAAAGIDAALLRIIYRVKKAYYDLAYLSRSISIAAEHLRLLTQWEAAARSRYATGSGGYADVIKAQVELGKMSDRLEELEDSYRPRAAVLNAVLNRPAGSDVPRPGDFPVASDPIDEAGLMRRLSRGNPELISLGHQAGSHLQAAILAGKQRYPDLTFGVNYIQTGEARMDGVSGSGADPILASVAVNIPIWRGKYGAAEREAARSFEAASSMRTARENSLAADLERAMFGYRDALRKIDLYGDTLLPKGRQSLSATSAAYETGTAGFLDVVDAERLLLEFQLAHARAAADLMIRLAEMEMLVGGPLSTGVNE